MVLIFKENSSTSCLAICWLTLTELLRAKESLSRTFPHTADVFQQTAAEPASSRNLPTLVPFWWWNSETATLHSATKRAFTCETCSGSQRTTPQQYSAIPSLLARYSRWYRRECGPLTRARDVTFSVPASDCAGVWFLWADHAFPYSHEAV